MMRKRIKFLGILPVAFMLAGCMVGPNQLGLTKTEWQALSSQQQQTYRKNYQQIQQWRSAQPKTAAKKTTTLQVHMADGTAMMPPFATPLAYSPVDFTISSDQCRTVPIHALNQSNQGVLGVCYKKNVLALDPSHYETDKWQGTLFIHANPLWQQGFQYQHLNSTGYARLKDVTVSVKATQQST